jgi:hypothetical protein
VQCWLEVHAPVQERASAEDWNHRRGPTQHYCQRKRRDDQDRRTVLRESGQKPRQRSACDCVLLFVMPVLSAELWDDEQPRFGSALSPRRRPDAALHRDPDGLMRSIREAWLTRLGGRGRSAACYAADQGATRRPALSQSPRPGRSAKGGILLGPVC